MTASRACLVTGCSSGIGRATARQLAQAGWTVYATARQPQTIEDLAASGCKILPLDVTDESSMRSAVETIEAVEGAVSVLVNNAGYSQSGALETLPLDRVRRQFETNAFGPLYLAQLVLPGMRRQGWGRVVNVSSMGGRLTLPGAGAYHASKYALEALSDAMRFEVAGFGVDVVVIEPGLIRTEFASAISHNMSSLTHIEERPYGTFEAAVDAVGRNAYVHPPLSWLGGSPEEVARVIERAVRAARPRTRYLVTPAAWVFVGLRAILPDRLWDAVMRLFYPSPRPAI